MQMCRLKNFLKEYNIIIFLTTKIEALMIFVILDIRKNNLTCDIFRRKELLTGLLVRFAEVDATVGR